MEAQENPISLSSETMEGALSPHYRMFENGGGVLEHPAYTHAWAHFGLNKPPKEGGWVKAGDMAGWVCHVEQGHYGHFSRKQTWLYSAHVELIPFIWGAGEQRIHPRALELHGYEKARRIGVCAMIGGKDKTKIRNATPPQFRDILMTLVLGSNHE